MGDSVGQKLDTPASRAERVKEAVVTLITACFAVIAAIMALREILTTLRSDRT